VLARADGIGGHLERGWAVMLEAEVAVVVLGIFGFGRRDEGRADGYGGRFGGYNKSIISICFLVRIKVHLPRSHQGYRVYHPSPP